MHTNSTPNYNLPQFVGTDIINPLTDINDAYSTIDTTMKNIADAEATDASAITALQTAVGNSGSGLVKAVADLEAQNGDAVLTTTAQTLSGAINELDNAVDTNTGNISTNAGNITSLQNKVGTATLQTTAQTCTEAINELNSNIKTGWIYDAEYDVTVTADGVKTYETMLSELHQAFITAKAALGTARIKVDYIHIGNIGALINSAPTVLNKDSSNTLSFVGSMFGTNAVYHRTIELSTTYKFKEMGFATAPGITYDDKLSDVPANGIQFLLHYEHYGKQR